jgi:enoyl-CoA hydratase/carnithine racemase
MNTFRFEKDGSIGRIILTDNPPGKQGLSFGDTLRNAVIAANRTDIRVLAFTSESGNFTVTKDPAELFAQGHQWFEAFTADVFSSIRMIEELRFPTVASVGGRAMGGGFELLLGCDFLVVTDTTALGIPEVSMGVAPMAGGVQRVAERVGRARAARITLLSEPVKGPDAVEIGLATHFAPAGELSKVTTDLVNQLANGPTQSYAVVRSLLRNWKSSGVASADIAMASITSGLLKTEDAQNAITKASQALKNQQPLPRMTFSGK